MSLQIIEAPATEPVTVAEVKARLRLTTAADDTLLGQAIRAAREFAEKVTRRSLVAKSYAYIMDRFPYPGEPIRVPAPPLVSVTTIKYLDGALVWQTWDAAEYFVAAKQIPGLIVPKPNCTYPAPANVPGAVEVSFTAGADPMEHVKEGIRQLAVHIYEHPEAITSEGLKEAPLALMSFFTANKVFIF